jgi:predicted glycoside hydrolase/deacetylase ChbG (UPF0249 family)
MKWLIVNADDLGISDRRNQGILEAHRKGIVTSASLLPYGEAFAGALKILRATPSLDVGLHLNLSEGEPLVLGHKTLVGPDGRFWGKEEARRRAREGLFDPAEVEREAEAQIDLLRQARLTPSHVNGHQHIHIYGALPEAIARAASRHGVRCFRCPADTMIPPLAVLDQERLAQVEDYRRHALRAAEVYGRAKLRSTEHFGGVALSHHLTLENLMAVLKELPAGLSELMVHPGYADAEDGFSGPDRERELRALTDPRLKILLRQQGIELTSWAKL